MSKRRVKVSKRCPQCWVNENYCFCAKIKVFSNQTPLLILRHHREAFLTSNTAHLANMTLDNVEIQTRGGWNPRPIILPPGHRPLYLFPHADAITLTKEWLQTEKQKSPEPFALVVPDGTWRQARRMINREEALEGIQCVQFSGVWQSRYHLRRNSRENGLCTFEAISHALDILEDNFDGVGHREQLDTMVYAHLHARNYICPWG